MADGYNIFCFRTQLFPRNGVLTQRCALLKTAIWKNLKYFLYWLHCNTVLNLKAQVLPECETVQNHGHLVTAPPSGRDGFELSRGF